MKPPSVSGIADWSWSRLVAAYRSSRLFIARRSLMATARLAKSHFSASGRWRRRRDHGLRQLWALIQDEFSFTWLFALAFVVPFVHVGWSLGYFADAASDPGKSENFLQALWQVEGATLGIALAVVIFVFQAAYASRLGGALRQFAEETGLFPIFYVGVFALGLVGLVLVGGGHGAPGGWAATWATIWAAGAGALLIVLFVSTIRAIEPSAMHMRRLSRARHEIERETERLIIRRIAVNFLSEFCKENRIEFSPGFATAPSGSAVGVRAGLDGEVRDIRLRVLRKLARAASRANQPQPRLYGYPELPVASETELLWAEPAVIEQVWRPKRVFRLGSRRRERAFRRTIQQLHDEATRIIASPTPGAYADILETYTEMMLALPRTWARYGQEYGPAVAGEISPFELGFLDYLGRDLYDELRAAVLGANREVARDALHFPLRVAMEAIPLRATALSGRMLQLLVAVIDVVVRAPESDTKDELIDSIALTLDNYGDFHIEPLITERESDAATRGYGQVLMLQLYETLAEISKHILDWDPSRTDLVAKFNGLYETFFQFWAPEDDRPQDWELELAEQRGAEADEIEALRAGVAEKQAEAAVKAELDDWRLVHRLGLMFWVLRHVREGADPAWADAWPTFANYFGDVSRMAQILDRAISIDFRDRGRWSNWVLSTLPSKQAHAIGVDNELIEAFIVRSLQLIPPDGPAPEIEPMEMTRARLDDPQAAVDAVIEQPRLAPLLPDDRLPDRARLLVDSLSASNRVRQDRDEQSIIEAPLVDEKLDEFEAKLRETWLAGRWLHRAIEASGAVEVGAGAPPERAGARINRWLPKSFFVEEPRVLGGDMASGPLGTGLVNYERQTYVDELLQAPLVRADAEAPLAEQLRTLIRSQRDAGFQPSLIFLPFNWTVMQALDITAYRGEGGEVERPAWSDTEGARNVVFGELDGIPVCRANRGIDDRIAVVDLQRFAAWREWLVAGESITIQFDLMNEVQAEEIARDQAEVAAGAEDLASAVQRIRLSVRLLVQVPYEIVVRERLAARSLEIPEGLRR